MEIRPLQIDDLFTISRILGKSSVNAEKLTGSEGAWLRLMESLCEASDDLLAWLADLVGKEVKEFSAMPAAAIYDIVEKLSQQAGFQDFLLWVDILSKPDGHQMLAGAYLILRCKYGIGDGRTPFSHFAQVLREVAESRRKGAADTLAEADEIIALARGRGK